VRSFKGRVRERTDRSSRRKGEELLVGEVREGDTIHGVPVDYGVRVTGYVFGIIGVGDRARIFHVISTRTGDMHASAVLDLDEPATLVNRIDGAPGIPVSAALYALRMVTGDKIGPEMASAVIAAAVSLAVEDRETEKWRESDSVQPAPAVHDGSPASEEAP
jgi:hypothetical protein